MASATFEDHPTDPDKVILRKPPRIDQGSDYDRGFIDGMQHQMQSSVDKAVNAMAKRTWVGLTEDERTTIRQGVQTYLDMTQYEYGKAVQQATELRLMEKNT